jgi:hypothetical protein
VGIDLRLVSWNVRGAWRSSPPIARQVEFLRKLEHEAPIDLLLAQEVAPSQHELLKQSGLFDWFRVSLEDPHPGERLEYSVAICGKSRISPI